MTLTDTELLRVAAIENKLNDLQTAASNLASRKELKNLLAVLTKQINDVSELISHISATAIGSALAAHKVDSDAHPQLADKYWLKTQFRNSSSGSPDAGFPVKLNSSGQIDPSMVGSVGVSDHGLLTGLGDDDHTQYHNDTRGDIRYYQKSEHISTSAGIADAGKPIILSSSGVLDSSLIPGGTAGDHGLLGGLSDDDHSQYLLANGNRIADKLSIGFTDIMLVNGVQYNSLLEINSNDRSILEAHTYSDTANNGTVFYMGRGRGIEGAESAVQSGDLLGSIAAVGNDGTDYALSARIDFVVDGTPSNNVMPGAIVFKVSDTNQNPAAALTLHQDKRAKFAGQIESQVDYGTAPLIVRSNTVVDALNADLLDGFHGNYYLNTTTGDDRYYSKSTFTDVSSGVSSGKLPIQLNASGLLDTSMLTNIKNTTYKTSNNYEHPSVLIAHTVKVEIPTALSGGAVETAALYFEMDHAAGQNILGLYANIDAGQSMVGGSFTKVIHRGYGDAHYVALFGQGFGYEGAMFRDVEEAFIATWQGNGGFAESVPNQANCVGFQALLADDAVNPGFVPNYGMFYANNATGNAITVRSSAFVNLGQVQIRITDTNFRNRLELYASGQVNIYGTAATSGSQNEPSSQLNLTGSTWIAGAASNRASIIKTVLTAQEPLEYHYYEGTDGSALLGWMGKASGLDLNGNGLTTVSGIQMQSSGSGIDMQTTAITNLGNTTLYSNAKTLNINGGSITTVGSLQMYGAGTGLDMQIAPMTNVGNVTFYNASQTLNLNTAAISTVGSISMYSLGTGIDMQATPLVSVGNVTLYNSTKSINVNAGTITSVAGITLYNSSSYFDMAGGNFLNLGSAAFSNEVRAASFVGGTSSNTGETVSGVLSVTGNTWLNTDTTVSGNLTVNGATGITLIQGSKLLSGTQAGCYLQFPGGGSSGNTLINANTDVVIQTALAVSYVILKQAGQLLTFGGLYGYSTSAANLVLGTTTHATKGKIQFGSGTTERGTEWTETTNDWQFGATATVSGVLSAKSDINLNSGIITGRTTSTAAMVLAVPSSLNRVWELTDYANYTSSHGHSLQTNPTLYLHSATDPTGDATQWMSLVHDTASGILSTGKGSLKLSSFNNTIECYNDVTASGALTIGGNSLFGGQIGPIAIKSDIPTGTTIAIDWNMGNSHTLFLNQATGNITVTLSNPLPGASYILKIVQHNTSARTITWPSNVKWPAGSAPTISTGAGAIDIMSLFYDGLNYFASILQNFS